MSQQEKIELIVDSEDNYLNSSSVFYIHPQRLSLIRTAQDKVFCSALIKNCQVDYLSSTNFSYIVRKMVIGAPIEIIINQPLKVMQSYDAKQVEANMKFAGFSNFRMVETNFVDPKSGIKYLTLLISAVRPEKNPNSVQVEYTTVKTVEKGRHGRKV